MIVNNRLKYTESELARLPAIPEVKVPLGPAPEEALHLEEG